MNPNEKITHKVSAEAAERFDRWLKENWPVERLNVESESDEEAFKRRVRLLAEIQLAALYISIWQNNYWHAFRDGAIVLMQIYDDILEKSLQKIPEQSDEIFQKVSFILENGL